MLKRYFKKTAFFLTIVIAIIYWFQPIESEKIETPKRIVSVQPIIQKKTTNKFKKLIKKYDQIINATLKKIAH